MLLWEHRRRHKNLLLLNKTLLSHRLYGRLRLRLLNELVTRGLLHDGNLLHHRHRGHDPQTLL